MSGFLVDTNVVSELRKGARANARVRAWFARTDGSALWLSVLVVGEIRRGIDSVRARDSVSAAALERWLEHLVASHAGRVIPIDTAIATAWGKMSARRSVPVIDGLLAATAETRGLVLATRNVKDVARTGVSFVNAFEAPVS